MGAKEILFSSTSQRGYPLPWINVLMAFDTLCKMPGVTCKFCSCTDL
jgi:hypothetical protein